MLDTFKRYFCRIGHCVETATCGVDCLQKLECSQPDVLVLDDELLWGGSNGVLEEMRKADDFREIQVVMTSDIDTWINDDVLPPIVSFLRKPFRLQSLNEEITKCKAADQNKRLTLRN